MESTPPTWQSHSFQVGLRKSQNKNKWEVGFKLQRFGGWKCTRLSWNRCQGRCGLAITIAQVGSVRADLAAGKAWEKFFTVKLLQKEVPFCETNGSRNCLFNFLSLCWLSVFWTNLKLSPRKLWKCLVVFGRSRQGFASWQTCCNTWTVGTKSERPQTEKPKLRTTLWWFMEKVEKKMCGAKSKVFESCWKYDLRSIARMLWLCCVAIGFGHFEAKFEAVLTCYSCSCFTVFATVLVIFAMFVVMSLTMHSLRHDFAIWLWAKKAPNRPLSESCVLCEAAFVLLSSPKMAAFSFAFITFAMLASQSASTRSHENHGMLMTPKEAESFLELHQQFMFAPISHPHHGKNGNKGIAAFFDFSMLFFVTSKPKVTAAKRQVQGKVPKFASNMLERLQGRLASDTFVCGQVRIRAMALHPKKRWTLYSKNSPSWQTCQVFWSCTCHACFNFPHTFVGIAMGKFRTKGLLFFPFSCSLMSKVYALWPLIPKIAPRSLALLRTTAITYSLVVGKSIRTFLAAIPLRKVNVVVLRGSSELSKKLSKKLEQKWALPSWGTGDGNGMKWRDGRWNLGRFSGFFPCFHKCIGTLSIALVFLSTLSWAAEFGSQLSSVNQ